MHEQASLLYFLSLWFSGTGALNCILTSIVFGASHRLAVLANVALMLILYAGIVYNAWRWRRNGDDLRFLRRAHVLFTVLGGAWGCLINLFALYGQPEQTGLLVGLASAIVSTPIISVPTAIALGFFIPEAVLSVIALSSTMPNADVYTAAAFTSFTFYVATIIVYSNRTFAGRSLARAALQRQIETVKVFLREYEEGSPDWLWSTCADGFVYNASSQMLAATELTLEQLQKLRLSDLVVPVDGAGSENPGQFNFADCLREGTPFRDLLVRYEVNDRTRWFALTGHPIVDQRGAMTGFRGIGRDVTANHDANEKINFLAHHDSLTGLLNRRSFIERADRLCAEGLPFALALIDLDSFKGVNDTYGHPVGDSLLQCVASRIRQSIRPLDIAARLGGDEFAVLIHDADEEIGYATAERLVTTLAERFSVAGVTLRPGASMGVSASPSQGTDTVRLLMLADLALYKAKESGKGTACVFAEWMEREYQNQMSKEADLVHAIESGEIVVAYQPVVDVGTGQVVSGEALARWQHPVRGSIMPSEFIPTAERSDLMERLGELVLRLACRDAATWDPPVQVNVNLSPRQLQSGRFLKILTEALEESRLAPQRLAVEVTEAVLLDSTEKTRQQLRAIRDLGVKLILDDFGSGYSSLTYLHEFEVDGIKIDADFTSKLSNRKVAAIYRMIARLASDLNIYVVAEGVEEPAQLEWLRQNGIQFAQGHLLGRPAFLPPTRRVEYLA